MHRTLALTLLLSTMTAAFANDTTVELVIKDHRFTPSEVVIPKDTKIILSVTNQDATAEEFESKTLHREKIIPGNSRALIRIGPLAPGTYEFVGEFHEDTAHGTLIVK